MYKIVFKKWRERADESSLSLDQMKRFDEIYVKWFDKASAIGVAKRLDIHKQCFVWIWVLGVLQRVNYYVFTITSTYRQKKGELFFGAECLRFGKKNAPHLC